MVHHFDFWSDDPRRLTSRTRVFSKSRKFSKPAGFFEKYAGSKPKLLSPENTLPRPQLQKLRALGRFAGKGPPGRKKFGSKTFERILSSNRCLGAKALITRQARID